MHHFVHLYLHEGFSPSVLSTGFVSSVKREAAVSCTVQAALFSALGSDDKATHEDFLQDIRGLYHRHASFNGFAAIVTEGVSIPDDTTVGDRDGSGVRHPATVATCPS